MMLFLYPAILLGENKEDSLYVAVVAWGGKKVGDKGLRFLGWFIKKSTCSEYCTRLINHKHAKRITAVVLVTFVLGLHAGLTKVDAVNLPWLRLVLIFVIHFSISIAMAMQQEFVPLDRKVCYGCDGHALDWIFAVFIVAFVFLHKAIT